MGKAILRLLTDQALDVVDHTQRIADGVLLCCRAHQILPLVSDGKAVGIIVVDSAGLRLNRDQAELAVADDGNTKIH